MQIVITGANRGIGAQIASLYTERGEDLIATSRDGSTGTRLDVTDASALRDLAGTVTRPLDLLICNAGVYLDRAHDIDSGFDPDLWAQTFAVNVTGVFQTVQAFLPALERAQQPKIAIISSRMGSNQRAKGGSYIYRASKSAAINLARNLAVDLAPRGCAVGVYHPGWVRTDMGGQEADLDVATSAAGLVQQFGKLSLETTGSFLNYDGTPLAF